MKSLILAQIITEQRPNLRASLETKRKKKKNSHPHFQLFNYRSWLYWIDEAEVRIITRRSLEIGCRPNGFNIGARVLNRGGGPSSCYATQQFSYHLICTALLPLIRGSTIINISTLWVDTNSLAWRKNSLLPAPLLIVDPLQPVDPLLSVEPLRDLLLTASYSPYLRPYVLFAYKKYSVCLMELLHAILSKACSPTGEATSSPVCLTKTYKDSSLFPFTTSDRVLWLIHRGVRDGSLARRVSSFPEMLSRWSERGEVLSGLEKGIPYSRF